MQGIEMSERLQRVIVLPNASIRQAIEVIDKNGLRGVFVCEKDGELLGIVMDSEVRRAALRKVDLNTSVKTIMKTSPFVIPDDIPTEERKRQLVQSGKVLAPVVDKMNIVVDYLYLQDIMDALFDQKKSIPEKKDGVFPGDSILVIGGAGYIGSTLVETLFCKGYRVRVLDMMLYGKDAIHQFEGKDAIEVIRGDCRDEQTVVRSLEGMDAVVHLGEIVGDPACEVDQRFTIDTNYSATERVARLCMQQGIERFVFASSCSVYGQNDQEVNEETEPNPISLYARCKIESERAILSYKYNYFCPTILRLATVHGRSYRQRFDLVVNLLAIKAVAEKKIQIFGGKQWRPFVAVKDVCRGIVKVLQSERGKVHSQIFNLGDSRENYQLFQIGNTIKDILPEAEVEVLTEKEDKRNYNVSFEKIGRILGFEAKYRVADSVHEIVNAYRKENKFRDYQEPKYHNVRALK